MNTLDFLMKVRWIRRRAKRIKRFYGISRALAVQDAHLDWVGFMGDCANPRYAFLFNMESAHHE